MSNRKIAIIGCASPQKDTEYIKKLRGYELWSMNNLFSGFSEVTFTKWFELHYFTRIGSRYIRRGQDAYTGYPTIKEYLQAIASLDIPVYMRKSLAPVKKSVKFPFKQIMRTFKTQYFGCSFAWMIAFALYEHLQGETLDTIALLGVELSTHEYYFQRPSTEYWIGRAQGMGIQVRIFDTCNLLKAPWIYAYRENFDCIDTLYVSVAKQLATMASIPMQSFLEKIYYRDDEPWLPRLQ